MNKVEIVTVLSELHKITGLRISLHGADYKEIAAYPESALPFCAKIHELEGEHQRCAECDGLACSRAVASHDAYIYKCRYGLTEAVSPLYNFGTLTGFLMMGQIAESKDEALDACRRAADALGENDARELAERIHCVDPEMLRSYVKIMTVCAQYLTLSNALPSERPTVAEMAKRFIFDNLSRKFSITDICASLGCSKSTLLTAFKKRYGMTVNAYVTEERLELSCRLLKEGRLTISEIAAETGFTDQSYFSKVFSAKYGIPPSEYRSGILNRREE